MTNVIKPYGLDYIRLDLGIYHLIHTLTAPDPLMVAGLLVPIKLQPASLWLMLASPPPFHLPIRPSTHGCFDMKTAANMHVFCANPLGLSAYRLSIISFTSIIGHCRPLSLHPEAFQKIVFKEYIIRKLGANWNLTLKAFINLRLYTYPNALHVEGPPRISNHI